MGEPRFNQLLYVFVGLSAAFDDGGAASTNRRHDTQLFAYFFERSVFWQTTEKVDHFLLVRHRARCYRFGSKRTRTTRHSRCYIFVVPVRLKLRRELGLRYG